MPPANICWLSKPFPNPHLFCICMVVYMSSPTLTQASWSLSYQDFPIPTSVSPADYRHRFYPVLGIWTHTLTVRQQACLPSELSLWPTLSVIIHYISSSYSLGNWAALGFVLANNEAMDSARHGEWSLGMIQKEGSTNSRGHYRSWCLLHHSTSPRQSQS